MKLKSTFITHSSGNEQIMVSVDGSFSGMVRSNSTAAEIINLLASDTTKDAIVDAMLEKYEAERELVERDVDKILASLRSIGALDE